MRKYVVAILIRLKVAYELEQPDLVVHNEKNSIVLVDADKLEVVCGVCKKRSSMYVAREEKE